MPLSSTLQLLKNTRSDPMVEPRTKNQPSKLTDSSSPIEYLKRFKQQKRQALANDDEKQVDESVVVEERKEFEETTPFRQTVFNPEQNPKAILKQEPPTVHQGSMSHLKMMRANS